MGHVGFLLLVLTSFRSLRPTNGLQNRWLVDFEWTARVINWIEDHPVVSSGLIFTAIAGIASLIRSWWTGRINLQVTLYPYGLSSEMLDGSPKLTRIALRIKILNRTRGLVTIQQHYLSLPTGRKMLANYFPLFLEDGTHMKIPIELDKQVLYLHGELNDVNRIDKLLNKKIRFVAVDHKGGKHKSNTYRINPEALSRDIGKIAFGTP